MYTIFNNKLKKGIDLYTEKYGNWRKNYELHKNILFVTLNWNTFSTLNRNRNTNFLSDFLCDGLKILHGLRKSPSDDWRANRWRQIGPIWQCWEAAMHRSSAVYGILIGIGSGLSSVKNVINKTVSSVLTCNLGSDILNALWSQMEHFQLKKKIKKISWN